jgi:hypothetical protein
VIGLLGGGTVDLSAHAETRAPEGRDWHVEIDTESAVHGGQTPAHLSGNELTLAAASAVVLRARTSR